MKNGSFFIFAYRLEAEIWNVHLLLEQCMLNFVVFIKVFTGLFIQVIRLFFSTGRSKQTLETVET